MTLHVVYDNTCDSCGAYFIPYEDSLPCPRCGEPSPRAFDYIPRAVQSLRFNRESYGSFTPHAWWVGSLGDHVLSILFPLFDGFAGRTDPQRGFEDFAQAYFEDMEWGDQEYLRDHVYGIALRVHQQLEK